MKDKREKKPREASTIAEKKEVREATCVLHKKEEIL